jgi:short-subunit dehydrogenase
VDIRGSRILVTGASRGIGAAIATDLAAQGAEVLAVARSEEQLEAQAETVDADSGGAIRPMPCDLTDGPARTALVAEAQPLDAVVANAGGAWIGAFRDMTTEEISSQLALNLEATIGLCHAVLPAMLERDRGHLVVIGSILGFAPGPPLTVYSATKAAVHAFAEGLRRELVGSGLRLSLIAPGPVKGTEALGGAGNDEEVTQTLQKSFDAFGTTPEEVAKAVRTALERDARPSARTITVPRLAGLSRVAGIPGADWALDQGFGLLRRAGVKL